MRSSQTTNYQHHFQQLSNTTFSQPCNCIGPQPGQPMCPCRMRDIKIIDGRYVQDLGPAPGQMRCLHEQFYDPNNPFKSMHLSCPCPKCSPKC